MKAKYVRKGWLATPKNQLPGNLEAIIDKILPSLEEFYDSIRTVERADDATFNIKKLINEIRVIDSDHPWGADDLIIFTLLLKNKVAVHYYAMFRAQAKARFHALCRFQALIRGFNVDAFCRHCFYDVFLEYVYQCPDFFISSSTDLNGLCNSLEAWASTGAFELLRAPRKDGAQYKATPKLPAALGDEETDPSDGSPVKKKTKRQGQKEKDRQKGKPGNEGAMSKKDEKKHALQLKQAAGRVAQWKTMENLPNIECLVAEPGAAWDKADQLLRDLIQKRLDHSRFNYRARICQCSPWGCVQWLKTNRLEGCPFTHTWKSYKKASKSSDKRVAAAVCRMEVWDGKPESIPLLKA